MLYLRPLGPEIVTVLFSKPLSSLSASSAWVSLAGVAVTAGCSAISSILLLLSHLWLVSVDFPSPHSAVLIVADFPVLGGLYISCLHAL